MKRLLEYAINLVESYRDGKPYPNQEFAKRRIEGFLIQTGILLEKYTYFQKIADERWGDRKNYFVGDITIITDEIAIVHVTDREQKNMYFKIINGRPTSSYSPDKEIAILEALGEKHEGLNSQFAYYACKILGKDLPK